MVRNYLITALRFLRQNKIFAGINILGLSIALAASFIILLFVINELSYDHCHKNRKNVFRVLNYYKDFNKTMSGTPYILSKALKEEFPQIEKAVRVKYMRGFKLKLKDEFINVSDAIATDSDVFDIFTLPLIKGSSHQNLLNDKNSMVISRELAEKVFPGQNPVGK
jgi:putative ABC transport system permease protein